VKQETVHILTVENRERDMKISTGPTPERIRGGLRNIGFLSSGSNVTTCHDAVISLERLWEEMLVGKMRKELPPYQGSIAPKA
jgi:hypothetical protein